MTRLLVAFTGRALDCVLCYVVVLGVTWLVGGNAVCCVYLLVCVYGLMVWGVLVALDFWVFYCLWFMLVFDLDYMIFVYVCLCELFSGVAVWLSIGSFAC